MKGKFLIPALWILSNILIFGQNPAAENANCSEKSIEKIASRGIKIGAKIDDIMNFLNLTEEERQKISISVSRNGRKNIGYETFGISPKPDDKRFEGITSYFFSFLDGSLESFSAHYSKPDWENIDQFTNVVAKSSGLPELERWSKRNDVSNNLQCGNYLIELSLGGMGSSLSVYNRQLTKILEQREQKLKNEIREKDIKTFKP